MQPWKMVCMQLTNVFVSLIIFVNREESIGRLCDQVENQDQRLQGNAR